MDTGGLSPYSAGITAGRVNLSSVATMKLILIADLGQS